MIIPSTGIAAYGTTDQISRQQAEKLPAGQAEEKGTEGSSFPTDRADLSAQALALSRSAKPAGAAAEQGETREEPPSPHQQNSPQSPRPIDIRV